MIYRDPQHFAELLLELKESFADMRRALVVKRNPAARGRDIAQRVRELRSRNRGNQQNNSGGSNNQPTDTQPTTLDGVYVSSNNFITFGTGSSQFRNFSETAPPIPKILLGAGDGSYQKIKEITVGSLPYRTHFVRFEGNAHNSGSGSAVIWEAKFYENEPNRIDIKIVQNPLSGNIKGVFSANSLLANFPNDDLTAGRAVAISTSAGYASVISINDFYSIDAATTMSSFVDDGYHKLNIPFAINFNGKRCLSSNFNLITTPDSNNQTPINPQPEENPISLDGVYISSNSYITFGQSASDYSVSTNTPLVPKIFMGAGDSSVLAIYEITTGQHPNRVHHVRFEGASDSNGNGNPIVWEMKFFETDNNFIDFKVINNGAPGRLFGAYSPNVLLANFPTITENQIYTIESHGTQVNVEFYSSFESVPMRKVVSSHVDDTSYKLNIPFPVTYNGNEFFSTNYTEILTPELPTIPEENEDPVPEINQNIAVKLANHTDGTSDNFRHSKSITITNVGVGVEFDLRVLINTDTSSDDFLSISSISGGTYVSNSIGISGTDPNAYRAYYFIITGQSDTVQITLDYPAESIDPFISFKITTRRFIENVSQTKQLNQPLNLAFGSQGGTDVTIISKILTPELNMNGNFKIYLQNFSGDWNNVSNRRVGLFYNIQARYQDALETNPDGTWKFTGGEHFYVVFTYSGTSQNVFEAEIASEVDTSVDSGSGSTTNPTLGTVYEMSKPYSPYEADRVMERTFQSNEMHTDDDGFSYLSIRLNDNW